MFNIVYGSKSKPFPAHDNSIIDLVYIPKHKIIVTASWDCSIKTFRYVGNVIDNEDHFYDHENQITALAVNNEENIVAFGDIEGNVICMGLEEKEQLFSLNMNSQKIERMHFIQNNVVIAAEKEMRIVDVSGSSIGSYMVDANNGQISDIELDNEHLFITTTNKQFILYDILQQKKIGNYFNDFTFVGKDKLPDEKGLTCITSGNDGLFIAVGSVSGTIYILRGV